MKTLGCKGVAGLCNKTQSLLSMNSSVFVKKDMEVVNYNAKLHGLLFNWSFFPSIQTPILQSPITSVHLCIHLDCNWFGQQPMFIRLRHFPCQLIWLISEKTQLDLSIFCIWHLMSIKMMSPPSARGLIFSFSRLSIWECWTPKQGWWEMYS